MLSERAFATDGRARNRCGRIAVSELFGQPCRFFSAMHVTKKLIYIDQTGSGDDPLVTYMPEPSCQKTEQLNLEFGARREVGVSTFGSKDIVRLPIPVEPGLSQPGAGRDDCLISRWGSLYAVES